MAQAPRDHNQVPTLLAVDDTTGEVRPVLTDADGNLLVVGAGGGAGTVTDVSVVSANGFAGSVANSTTTPAITLTTTVTGILSGNGTTISSAPTTGSGSVMLSTSPVVTTDITIPNGGLHILDTDASHDLIITPGSDLTADRILTITTGDAARTLTLSGNLTVSAASTINQNVSTTASPSFGALQVTGAATFTSGVYTANFSSGTTSYAIGTNNSGTRMLINLGTFSEAASGTHPLLSAMSILTQTVTGGAASVTNTASLYIEGAMSATVTGANYALWVDAGTTQLDGDVNVGGTLTLTNDLTVANGGTGASSQTAYAVLCGGTTATGAYQSIASVGTAGQVLTSNGAGALPTFQAAAGGTPRRNLNVQLNTTNGQKSGTTDPTDSTSINGIQCSSPGVNDGSSMLKINSSAANSQWDFYDKNPEMNVDINYTAGSATGDGRIWFGDTGDTSAPAQTLTTKSMFIMADTVSGTITWYAVNANGTTNTNTSLAGITSAQQNCWRIVKNGTTNIKFYCNYTLVATHTTNLPSGDCAATSWLVMGIDNDAGDTTTRTAQFGYCDVLLDSPTT